eukprot:gene6162-6789_t
MGCCQSSTRSDANPLASNAAEQHHSGGSGGNTSQGSSPVKSQREEKIELAFRAKRANVFNHGLDLQRETFIFKQVPKTAQQMKMLVSALSQNYIFTSLTEQDVHELALTMEAVSVSAGENIITQGEEGRYFYVIESGQFTVIVDKKTVAKLSPGNSFGELALIYNSPRQATIQADNDSVVFSLDRETYKLVVAQSSSNRAIEIKRALSHVPLLQELTEEQLDKVADSVEIFPYNTGDVIIRKGSEGNVFYMIKEGTVLVSDVGASFADHTLTTGDYFGERALITGEPRAATITAQSHVKLLALDREAFNTLLGPLRELLDHNMNIRILKSIKLFEKLNKQEIMRVSQAMVIESFPPEYTIIKQGEQGRKFYIIKQGTAKVEAEKNGSRSLLSELRPGSYFGEMALLDNDVRKADVISISEVVCFVLDRDAFIQILSSIQHIMSIETQQRWDILKKSLESSSTNLPAPEKKLTNIPFTDLITLGVLGSGTFGRVTLVQDKKNKNNVYALKALLKSEIVANKQQTNILNEKNIMITSNHPFILQLYQTYKDSKKLYMLLEFIQGGELFNLLHTNTSDGVPNHHAIFYASVILLALEYLHGKDIAYRDMKPENCLIDKAGYPKLVDFGFAKVITGKSYTLCGTPEYLAPELVLARGHTKAVDYWALGILIYEMQAGYSPFLDPHDNDQVVICKNIVSGRLVFPKNFPPDCKDLVKRLLSREVNTRLGNLKGGVEDIKTHKWFSTIDFDAVFNKTLKAPWVPKITSLTDTSHFDPYAVEEHVDNGYVDHGNWDKDF